MLIYCICTQYLVRAPFALITGSIRRGMEVISLWHCWGGMKPRFLWLWPSAHLHVLVSFFLIFLLTIPRRFYEVQVWWVCWPIKHTNTCSFNQLLVLLAVWAGAKSCWKMKSASLKSCQQKEAWSASKCIGKRVQWRWFSNTGLQATWAMSFSTLPPDSRTLVSKWNTCSHLKRGLWTTGHQSSSSSS